MDDLDGRTTEGLMMAETHTHAPPGVLLVTDVARIWTEETRRQHEQRVADRDRENEGRELRGLKPLPPVRDFKAILPATVLTYLRRYADTNPMPQPKGRMGTSRQVPWWSTRQEKALRDWWNSRPGHGHGRGGWPAGRPRDRTPAT